MEVESQINKNFNSTMVRLREEEEPENAVKDSEFQFHDGPIERVVP